ncbi:Cupredoxin [Trematosphaeria pertusa]|uniref:Cupredoxin n=1 Tax=Trematosphaeria pertusa TaxID=390896 RepID=A0A6A6IMP5_9PLEO|nr:Cupredoxin [Trematosphaeria pertusa]KAF2251499.1 Cupredoxin [Trematosphaeria pertusa]
MVSSSFIAAALSALPLAFAYYPAGNATATYASAPSGTGTSSPSQYTVAVGQNGLTFTPDTVLAQVGSKITFQFFPKNHSVVQSDFKNPCNPSDDAIFSGFVPTPSGLANQTFTVTVADEKPIWLYCAQNNPKPHCAAGMVAVINPPAYGPNTLDAFKELAAKTNGSTVPAGGPSGGELSSPSPSSPSSAPSSAPLSTLSSVPSGSSVPSSSGTSTSVPPESTGAASSLAVSGMVGMVAMFAGLML